jgi:hypothetical protein
MTERCLLETSFVVVSPAANEENRMSCPVQQSLEEGDEGGGADLAFQPDLGGVRALLRFMVIRLYLLPVATTSGDGGGDR